MFRFAGEGLPGKPKLFSTSSRWKMEEGPGLSLPSAAIKIASQVALVVKNPPANAVRCKETWVRFFGREDPLE